MHPSRAPSPPEPLPTEPLPPESDEAELAARFAAGDPSALTEMVNHYQHTLAHLASRLLGWPGDDRSADLVQEVFVRALMTRRRFRARSSLRTWLTRITINECRAHLRKERRRSLLLRLWALGTQPDEVVLQPHPLETDERNKHVRQAIQSLPPASREVVVLHYLEQMPVAGVAEVLGISPGAVSTRLTRARQQLTQILPDNLLDSQTT